MLENYRTQIKGVLNDLQVAPSGVVLYTGIDILERANPNDTPIQNVVNDVLHVILRHKAVNFRMAYDFLRVVEHLWDLIYRDPAEDVRALIERISKESELRYLYSFSAIARQFLMIGLLYRVAELSTASCDFLRYNKLPFNIHEKPIESQKCAAENAGCNSCETEDKNQSNRKDCACRRKVPVKKRNNVGQHSAALKTYKVAVSQTHYGEVVVQARSEAEALEIANGNRAMHNGDSATQHFCPMSHDTYLTICEFDDGKSVKECN